MVAKFAALGGGGVEYRGRAGDCRLSIGKGLVKTSLTPRTSPVAGEIRDS